MAIRPDNDVDSPYAKEERIQKLLRFIEALTYECEDDYDYNTLAMTLLFKAIQSFEARYSDELTQYALDCMMRERRLSRSSLPESGAHVEGEGAVQDWFNLNTAKDNSR